MKSSNVFATRVGTRILVLFFVGAIVPVGLLSFLSHRAVTRQLVIQSEARLEEEAKTARQLTLERLSTATTRVSGMAAGTASQGFDVDQPALATAGVAGVHFYSALELTSRHGRDIPRMDLDQKEVERVAAGGAVLKMIQGGDGPRIFAATPAHGLDSGIAWAELESDSILSAAMILASDPQFSNVCFITALREPLGCAHPMVPELVDELARVGAGGTSNGSFRFEGSTGLVRGVWRALFLRSAYDAPPWYVIATQDEAVALSPVQGFTSNLLAALGAALGLVLLMAHFLVDRTMSPLARLTEGTRSLSEHNLSARVEVDVEDEFGDLADSFNSMANALETQFKQLSSARAIDDAVLRDRDDVGAVRALLDGLMELLPVTDAAVLMLDVGREGAASLFRRASDGSIVVDPRALTDEQLAWIPRVPDWVLQPGDASAALAPTEIGQGYNTVYAVPMIVQSERVGVVVVSATPRDEFEPEAITRAIRLVGRAAVGLNEVRLRNELTETSEDALKVLANAIDAKSRWTAGHSMRVTALADEIGARLGLRYKDRDVLHRGGLLHDIGKIGVPLDILDFPGRLTDEMFAKIQEHPEIGARILQPMKMFRPLIPIVLHHHEKWNGKGYPHGLAGNRIPELARILAVADVFDAMITPRPYRDALPRDFVISHIEQSSGEAFDPKVVTAFSSVMSAGWLHEYDPGEVVIAGV